MKYEYVKGCLSVDGNWRYCPMHGGGGEVCGNWCAMFEYERVERGLEFIICHAYKAKFKLESSPDKGVE